MEDWSMAKKIGYWILITPLIIIGLGFLGLVTLGLLGGLLFGWTGNSL